jgi:type III restriction enzyme
VQIKYTTQIHQTKAIESIVSLFQGQSRQVCEYDILDGEAVCGNGYILDDVSLLENLQSVQKDNRLDESFLLQSRDFSVEMETGTGKTYVYIKSTVWME